MGSFDGLEGIHMKTILITGANRGIGLELTRQYLASGCRVIACCRNPQHAEELKTMAANHSNQLIIQRLDVTNSDNIKQLSAQLDNESIDILINNAGVIGSHTNEFGAIDTAAWLDTLMVNTIAPTLVTQGLIHLVEKGKTKLIVNVSSKLGSISMNADSSYYYYRSSKAALNAITKNLSIDLKPKNITVISLHPGLVQTDMGGQDAPLKPDQSVKWIMQTINNINLKDSGSFFNYDGSKLTW